MSAGGCSTQGHPLQTSAVAQSYGWMGKGMFPLTVGRKIRRIRTLEWVRYRYNFPFPPWNPRTRLVCLEESRIRA